jgi:hypothetical protein
MTIELLSLVINYSRGDISKEEVVETYGEPLMELLEIYLNDKNSSSLRQIITCEIIGIQSNENKLGYDGHLTKDEIKPKNINSEGTTKLDAGGSYSDLTFKRHFKYVEDNPTIHVSGFVDGLLMFVLKLPYTDLQTYFHDKLLERFPNGDEVNKYYRSASFSFINIKSCPNLEVEFIRNNIENYSNFFTKDLYEFLTNQNND